MGTIKIIIIIYDIHTFNYKCTRDSNMKFSKKCSSTLYNYKNVSFTFLFAIVFETRFVSILKVLTI